MYGKFFKDIPLGVYHMSGQPTCTIHGCSKHGTAVVETDACNAEDDTWEDSAGFVLVLCYDHLQDYVDEMRQLLKSWNKL